MVTVQACTASALRPTSAVRTQIAVIVAPPLPVGIARAAAPLSAKPSTGATPNKRTRSEFAGNPVKERHETDITQDLFLEAALPVANIALERLDGTASDRRDQNPRRFELREQGLRLGRRRRRDQNAVERRLLRPPFRAVSEARDDVAELQRLEARLGLAHQRAVALDGVDEPREPGEHGRLVAGTGADLEHAGARLDHQRLGHQRDDVGLADRLATGDGQGGVLPRPILEELRREEVAR